MVRLFSQKSYAFFCTLYFVFFPIHTEQTILGWQPDWDSGLDFNEIERRLQTEAIVERKDMHSFLRKSNKKIQALHHIEIVVLESGLKAVFKDPNACFGEVAAYKASKTLGLRLVPPTVIRTIDGQLGSLQFYVPSKIDLLRNSHGAMNKISPKDKSDRSVFEYVFNRWDTHAGNQIVAVSKDKYNLALIDNAGLIFLSRSPKFNVKNIDATTLLALNTINNQKALEEIWSDFIPFYPHHVQIVIQRTLHRIDHLQHAIETKKVLVKNYSSE